VPTQGKIDRVNELQSKLEKCSIAVTATYSNIGVNEMTDLRRRTRDAGVEFVVIKNTLMHRAADAANKPQIKEIVNGPTAIAFGYDEPIDVAKTLSEYIRTTRSPLAFQGAVIGDGPPLPAADVERLAALPPKPVLVSTLLGQLQAPLYQLLGILNGPLQSFGGILQARIRQIESGEASA
jgi:large subunit ribosomal protein L10